MITAARDLQDFGPDAEGILRDVEDLACKEVERIAGQILRDPVIRAELGEPSIEEIGGGGYLLRRGDRTVSLRPGLVGELGCRSRECLAQDGAAPAVFVNIMECRVSITPYETDLDVFREIADQLKV